MRLRVLFLFVASFGAGMSGCGGGSNDAINPSPNPAPPPPATAPTPPSSPPSPSVSDLKSVEGDWRWLDAVVRVKSTGNNTYSGTLLTPGSGEALPCRATGSEVWSLQGQAPAYGGSMPWLYPSDCRLAGNGASTWIFTSEFVGQVCSTDPTGQRGVACWGITSTRLPTAPMDETPASKELNDSLAQLARDILLDLTKTVGNGWAKSIATAVSNVFKAFSFSEWANEMKNFAGQNKDEHRARVLDAYYASSDYAKNSLNFYTEIFIEKDKPNPRKYIELTVPEKALLGSYLGNETGATEEMLDGARKAAIKGISIPFLAL